MWNKIKKVIKNRSKILEGFNNFLFKKVKVEKIAEERLKICRSNICKFYDPEGKSENAVVPGMESCGACGCSLEFKTRCLDCKCGLEDVGEIPLW